ncbi:MAG: hypothetical protein FK730_06705 [Asgard group archaeon]|nr:hypothetical protein [Asgard group archaeon]
MKKKLIGYMLVTTVIILSLIISIPLLNYARRGQTYTDISLTNDLNHVIIDNIEFDLPSNNFSEEAFNNSITIYDLISDDLSNGIITIGSVENSTNNDHGFIQFYKINNPQSNPDIHLTDTYVDANSINETEYIKGHTYNKTLDGQDTSGTIALLKRVNGVNFVIDFLQLSTTAFKFNSSFIISEIMMDSVFDFEFFDIDNDNIPELYLIGTNDTSTQNVLFEFTYNTISESFDLNNVYNWTKGSSTFVDFKYYFDETNTYFTLTNLLIGTTLQTNVLVISSEKTPLRDLDLESNLTINYGSHIFRAYSSELINEPSSNIQEMLLFGTFIENGLDNYPFCLKLSIDNGIVTTNDEYQINQTPMWSLDGLIVDIDLDGEDEIIMSTYDLLSDSISDYRIMTSTNFVEIEIGSSNLRRIRASTLLTIESYHIGVFLGKNLATQDVLAFHILYHIPFQVKGTGEILHDGRTNNITIESTSLTGSLRNRNDIKAEIEIIQISNSIQIINSFPSDISLDIPVITNTPLVVDLSINISKNENIIQEIIKAILIDNTPEFSVTTPSSIIVIRNSESKRVDYEIEIDNYLASSLNVNITIILERTIFTTNYQEIISTGQSHSIHASVSFAGTVPHSTYAENIEVTIESNVGTFIQESQIIVTNQFRVVKSDLIILLCVILAIIFVGYISFLETIYKNTKQSINDYYTKDKPINLEIKLNKNRAINALITEYVRKRNWEAGIKIAEDYKSPYIFTFKKYKVQNMLSKGQSLLKQGNFEETLSVWEEGRGTLEEIGTHEQIDTLDWMLVPLRNIVKAKTEKGSEKVTLLQKEFQNLNDMKELRKAIFNIVLDIPLHLVAEELGLALKDTEDLQTSLSYLQIAYQSAPAEEKNRIVSEITSLISLGVTPTEFSLPVNHEEIRERISKRTIRCFSCGEERTNVNEPCSNCGIDTVQCSVCKLPISFGSDYLECYHCQNVAHKEHLLEWVKVKGTCPICQQKLLVDKLAVAQEKD